MLAGCGGGSSSSIDAPAANPADADPSQPDADPSAPDAAPPVCPGGMPPMRLTQVVDGLDAPVFVTTPPDDAASLFVVEKGGTIRIVRDGQILATPFLDIADRVNIPDPNAEGGLVAMVFDPGYATNGRFYVHFTAVAEGAEDERVTVEEFTRSIGNPDVANQAPTRALFNVEHGGWNHVGGMLAFGPDGALYDSVGDAALEPSPAPDMSSHLGKIMRIPLSGGAPSVWARGLRNPWRFAFDGDDLYIGDVGQNMWEEIDVVSFADGPGLDFGWDTMEGAHCYNDPGCTPVGIEPAVEHSHDEATSIIGGYVYRGTSVPCLYGRYLYSDYGTARVWSFLWNGSSATDPLEHTDDLNPPGGIVSFGQDAGGELYLVSIYGGIYRLELE